MSSSDERGPTRRGVFEGTAATALALGLGLGSVAVAAEGTTTVARYLVRRLAQLGVDVLFGVPGATCDPVFEAAGGALDCVVTASDLEAGYAVDGYARFRGLGVVAVTYGVGTLALSPVIAGAFAERSPIVLVNGGPTHRDLELQAELGTLYSHSCGKDFADRRIFAEITAAAERVEAASRAPEVIDRVLRAALVQSRPVYLEIPKDLWYAKCSVPRGDLDVSRPSTPVSDGVLAPLRDARRPLLLLGIELARLGLQDRVEALVRQTGLPYATTYLAKAVIPEQTPGFVGVYAGSRTVPAVRRAVEEADCVVCLGTVMGRQYRDLVTRRGAALIRFEGGAVRTGSGSVAASLDGALDAIERTGVRGEPEYVGSRVPDALDYDARRASQPEPGRGGCARGEEGVSYDEVCREVSAILDERFLVVTDTSLSMYAAAELDIQGRGGFLCNAVWQSIGYSPAAAVGVSFAQERRPVVICGDGGFQMTAMALSTLARHRKGAIVLVLDNALYAIEQWLLGRKWFAEATCTEPIEHLRLHPWDYPALATALGVPSASRVTTTEQLHAALERAVRSEGPTLIAVRVPPHDLPAKVRA